jgi:hypothetical protein
MPPGQNRDPLGPPLSRQPKVPLSCIKPCIFPLVSVGIDDGSVEMAGRLAHVDGGELLHPLSKSRPPALPLLTSHRCRSCASTRAFFALVFERSSRATAPSERPAWVQLAWIGSLRVCGRSCDRIDRIDGRLKVRSTNSCRRWLVSAAVHRPTFRIPPPSGPIHHNRRC